MNFFRLQAKGVKFEEMKSFISDDGGDGLADSVGGLCVTGRIGLNFGGAEYAYGDDDAEVVVMSGHILAEIYDGYRISPTAEIARFSFGDWKRMVADESAYDYE